MSLNFHQLRNKGVKTITACTESTLLFIIIRLLKNSSRDTIPLTQVNVADLDPGSGIGFFRIFDPKTHIFESLTIFW